MRQKSTNLTEALGHHASDKRLDILRRVGAGGSISEAARGADRSFHRRGREDNPTAMRCMKKAPRVAGLRCNDDAEGYLPAMTRTISRHLLE